MALSQTLTLSHGREFGGSNPGVRLDDSSDPVELDSGFFTVPDADSEVTGAFVKATFRARTAWLHLNTDLWLANIDGSPAGARNDLGVDLYSPTTDKWCRLAFSTYATKSSRSDNLAQVSFNLTTPVPDRHRGPLLSVPERLGDGRRGRAAARRGRHVHVGLVPAVARPRAARAGQRGRDVPGVEVGHGDVPGI